MTHITVNGKNYGVEFRHRTQKLSRDQKRPPNFPSKRGFKGLTICLIITDGDKKDEMLTGIGLGLCVAEDNFQRRKGMREAFTEAAADCKLFDTKALMTALDETWPALKPVAAPPPKTRKKLTKDEVEQRKAGGEIVRAGRAAVKR